MMNYIMINQEYTLEGLSIGLRWFLKDIFTQKYVLNNIFLKTELKKMIILQYSIVT